MKGYKSVISVYGWVVQKWLNRTKCRLGGWLMWAKGTICYCSWLHIADSGYATVWHASVSLSRDGKKLCARKNWQPACHARLMSHGSSMGKWCREKTVRRGTANYSSMTAAVKSDRSLHMQTAAMRPSHWRSTQTCIIGVKVGQIHSPPQRGDKTVMQPFVKILWPLAVIIIIIKYALIRVIVALMMQGHFTQSERYCRRQSGWLSWLSGRQSSNGTEISPVLVGSVQPFLDSSPMRPTHTDHVTCDICSNTYAQCAGDTASKSTM